MKLLIVSQYFWPESFIIGRRYYQEHFDHGHLIDQLIVHLQAVSQGRKDIQ